MNNEQKDYRELILARYCGEYPPISKEESANAIRKSSEDIVLELRPVADFNTDEVSKYLIEHNYYLDITEGVPEWLLANNKSKELPQ